MRLASVSAVLVLAAAVLGGVSFFQGSAQAAPPVGGYEILASTSQPVQAVGGTVTVTISSAKDPAAGNWQAVQAKLDYSNAVLSTNLAAVNKVPAAPGVCAQESVAATNVLVGCLDLSGPNQTYTGGLFTIVFTCTAAGVSPITLNISDVPSKTFVNDGTNDYPLSIQNPTPPSITCVNVADVVTTKTGPATVNAGAPVQYVVTATNTGPATWFGAIVGDDLPDNANVSACTPGPGTPCASLQVDADGNATYETGPVSSCIFFPAFPNPFPVPPAVVTNLVLCPATAAGVLTGIAPGGSMRLTVNVAAPAACNSTLVDQGIATADSATAPNFGQAGTNPDPDFLDGVQLTDDNFVTFTTQVNDCPVTIAKTGPAGGLQGQSGSYTLTVTNAGPSTASNVVVTDNVPAGLAITSVVGTGCGFVGQLVTCNTGTLAPGNTVITINFTETAPGTYCNTANGTWTRVPSGATASNSPCFVVVPPFNGLVKSVNGQVPGEVPANNDGLDNDGDTVVDEAGETKNGTTIEVNLWLCTDQSGDSIDNDGNSTVDDEPATCNNNGEGVLNIGESIFTREDCDTRNDDDDNDGEPLSNSPTIHGPGDDGIDNNNDNLGGSNLIDDDGDGLVNEPGEDLVDEPAEGPDGLTLPNPAFRPECPQPTLQDYIDDIDGDGNGNVDKNGGETGEGLGAFEFQLKFDHKIFDINITGATIWANGRAVNCTMTIITENDIRFGCVSQAVFNPALAEDGGAPGTCYNNIDEGAPANPDGADQADQDDCYNGEFGFNQVSGVLGATITVRPEDDLIFRIRPTKDNGVVRRLLDENCEVADIYGDIFPLTNAGLTPDCTDVDITIRRLEGDVDADCDVDVNDAQRIAFRYGSFFGHLVYDQNYDMEPWPTADFDIDIKDLQFVFGRDGSTCADPIPDNQHPLAATGVGQP